MRSSRNPIGFNRASLKNASITNSDFISSCFNLCNLQGTNFSDSDLSYSTLLFSTISDSTNFNNCRLTGTMMLGVTTPDGRKITKESLLLKGVNALEVIFELKDIVELKNNFKMNAAIEQHYISSINFVLDILEKIHQCQSKNQPIDTHDLPYVNLCTRENIELLTKARNIFLIFQKTQHNVNVSSQGNFAPKKDAPKKDDDHSFGSGFTPGFLKGFGK